MKDRPLIQRRLYRYALRKQFSQVTNNEREMIRVALADTAVSAFFGLGVGSLIGFMVSIVATLVFALIPRQGLEYVAPTPQTELSGAGFEPFKDTQGF